MAYNPTNKPRRKLLGAIKSLYVEPVKKAVKTLHVDPAKAVLKKAKKSGFFKTDDFHSRTSKKLAQKTAKARKKLYGGGSSIMSSAHAGTPVKKKVTTRKATGPAARTGTPVKKATPTKRPVRKAVRTSTRTKVAASPKPLGVKVSAGTVSVKSGVKKKRKGRSIGAGNRMVRRRKKK